MDPRLGTAIVVVVGVPAVLIGYIWLTELLLRAFAGSASGQSSGPGCGWRRPSRSSGVFLVYPTMGTIVRSFENKAGTSFIGLDNYACFFTNDDVAHRPPQQPHLARRC